jgi:hypothetical protein
VTFGFRELGQGARALEQRLRVLTAFELVGEDDWRAWLSSLDEFVRSGLAATRARISQRRLFFACLEQKSSVEPFDPAQT